MATISLRTLINWQLAKDWQLLEHQFVAVFSINNSWIDCYFTFPELIKTALHLIWCKQRTFAVHQLALLSDNTIFWYENEGCLQGNYVIWSKFLLEFVFYGLQFTVQYGEFSLANMSGYNHPVRRKRYSELNRKNYLGLDFYFGRLQFTPDKYVRCIWQLRPTNGKYVVNVRRGRLISHTLK